MVLKKYLRPAALTSVLVAAQMMTGCSRQPQDRTEPSEAVSETTLSETETEETYSLFPEETETEEPETEEPTEEPMDLTDPEHAENIDRFLRRTMDILGEDFHYPQRTDQLRQQVPEENEESPEDLTEETTEAATEELEYETATEDLILESATEAHSETLPETATENLSETFTEVFPEESTEDTSEALTEIPFEEADSGMAEGQTEVLTEDMTETATEELPESATEELSEELTEIPFEEVDSGMAEGQTEVLTEDMTETASKTLPETATEDMTETASETPVALHQLRHPVSPADHVIPLEDHYRITGWSLPNPQRSLNMLETVLTRQIAGYEGSWSVYLRDLSAVGAVSSIGVNVMPVKSASVMKLFIMGAAYDAIDNHTLARTDEVISRISGMIRSSSNTDANLLLEILGGGSIREGIREVNNYINRSGASGYTRLYNGFDNDDYLFDPENNNTVYPPDCADLLEKIYHRTFSTRKVCNEIENLMIEQETRYKIPKGVANVSDGVTIGNKTGEMDGVENDVAIVYSPACDYILCVFSSGWSDKDTALTQIQNISEQVYRYYNDSRWLSKTVHLLPEKTGVKGDR